MEKINTQIKNYIQFFVFLIILTVLAIIQKTTLIIDIFMLVPQAISIYAILVIVFKKWIWKWSILQGWMIKIPNLQGTWKGTLQSNWINPETGQGIGPIDATIVIKQTYSSIKCILMTKESTSYSSASSINMVSDCDDLYLTYNYTNKPKASVMDRSNIHDGASILKIIQKPDKILNGIYWTTRLTRGDMNFKFDSKDLVEKF